jgi:YesN/AraC family two-component response regulator
MACYLDPQDTVFSLLAVEDDPIARDLMGKAICYAFPKLRLLTAENGVAGLELYKEHHPDIVLTDVRMPVMDGIAMATEIKRLDPEAVIAVVSAYCDTAQYLSGAEAIGIHHYIRKPVDFDALFATIRECLGEVSTDQCCTG